VKRIALTAAVKRIALTAARKKFAEIVGEAQYGNETTVLTRHGKDIAAVIPISALPTLPDPNKRKPASSAVEAKKSRSMGVGS